VTAGERILVALDTPDADEALRLVGRLVGRVGGFKIGLELFSSAGPDLVRRVSAVGARVFVDLKLHDIPNTVAGAAAALGRLGVTWFTLHALGGAEMIAAGVGAAGEAALAAGHEPPTALAVTVLTSHDDATLAALGLTGPCRGAVLRLVELARRGGADGIVCSASEVADVRTRFPGGTLVVPGIRPAGAAHDDQKRIATPSAAVAMGADRLVIGRPITRAADPAAAVDDIVAELGGAPAR